MKKRIFSLLLLSALLLAAIPAAAYSLTPAVRCMADDVTLIKTGLFGNEICFSQADFRQALGVSGLDAVTVVTLPNAKDGVLAYGGVPVIAGQSIPYNRLSSLTFTPLSVRTEEANFSFRAGNLAGGADIACRVRFVKQENAAPTVLTAAESAFSMQTRAGVSLFGCMAAEDPEGDALSFRVVDYPDHGKLTVVNAAEGDFRYEPNGDYTGKDGFRYVVRDEYGNWSGVADVEILVRERGDVPTLSDVMDRKNELSALEMVDRNIMQATLSGDSYFFHPEGEITRGDFIVMAMKASGISPIPGLADTCFDNNDAIPASIRPYLATAQRHSIIVGTFSDGKLVYDAGAPVTRAEAAVILSRIVDPEEPLAAPAFSDNAAIPVWARSAIGALYGIGAYPVSGAAADPNAALTREDAAGMLYRVILLLEE